MKDIRNYIASLAAASFVMAMAVPSHAFTSAQVVSETAVATITGGSAAMNVTVRNLNGTPATNITWSAAAGSSWTQASQYIQIDSTLTLAGSGIQTYMDNTNANANPKYTGVVSPLTVSPAGLINTGATATAPLPTAWQIVGGTNTPVAADDPNNSSLAGHMGYAWFYHEDKAQVANNAGVPGPFVNAASYVEMEIAGQPPQIQFAQGSFGNSTTNTNRVYLEANFQNALGGQTYQSSTLTVEMFTP